ncbi:RagB/SusD family nutrient uptake outer membrane protein [Cellulophaga baltica]|uniref:RagB/SusD family nutrient uptake outer membrane protein n=1 Tax=Cellulophaga TaxID=104264 RepID=UPI001C07191C|nr:MULTISPECIES: RagB/SusD family nutrient uptake outer membrane protein [Cellulophaga]MBU2996637.1 RagB/SusD family nutrient uptake outer membrane protein [Cellulophaga baltica]MDO6768031.1 RagB/SusD family nutrient uptake outer membrane protein [Cellulophaga sp. 1_MG-2023]
MEFKNSYIKLKSSLVLLTVLFFAVSCEDYLEEEPGTLIDSDYIYTTEDGLQSGVVSLYTINRDRYEYSSEDYMAAVLMSSRSDLAFSRSGYTGLMGRYQRGISSIDYGTELASTLFWKHFYNLANKATALINAAEAMEDIDEDVKNQIIAEAKFFRAEAYFYLYRMYNNIYVTTETVTVDNAFDVISDKSSEEEIFELINSDLTFSIENLEWTDTFGRVTKGTAKHVKAKVAMWQSDWAEAASQAISLIEEGPHSLVSSTAEVFAEDRNNSESLFVIQSEDDLSGGGSTTMINANYVTQYFNISGIEANVEQGGRGFSRILPNLYLLNLLAEDENDTRDDDTYFRLKYYYTSGDRIGEEVDDYAPITDLDNPSDTYTTYYQRMHPSCIKFAQEDDDPDTYLNRSNVTVYRLAETYLIAAEALMRSSEGDPLPYLNAIRTRAGAAAVTTVDQQAILDERARELAFEGQRWFTLKRMGQDVIDYQITNYAGDGEYYPNNLGENDPRDNWQSHFINWPIAEIDLDLLGSSYPQNDGY